MENKLLNLDDKTKEAILSFLDIKIKNTEVSGLADFNQKVILGAMGTAYWAVKQFIEVNS